MQGNHPNFFRYGAQTIDQVVNPTNKIYFMDHSSYLVGKWSFNPYGPAPTTDFPSRWHSPFTGYYGKSNVLWFDGHVSVEPGDLARTDWEDYYFNPLYEQN